MIDRILDRLQKVQPRGKQKWMACCPAHEDRSPSLAIQQLTDGRILMKCFAGCEVNDVLASIGLTMSELFPDRGLGEFRGWEQIQRDMQRKRRDPLEHERTILQVADGARARGERLSPQDMERERQAYLALRGANANNP